MAFLLVNLPPVECFVRKEFLYNLEPDSTNPFGYRGKGEFEPCIWISAKSQKGRAWYIESLITRYAALYDKLPLHAFVHRTDVAVDSLEPLNSLQLWDCFSYEAAIIEKNNLRGLNCQVRLANNLWMSGNYMFTIDNVVSDPNTLDTSFTQVPAEHKSFNFIRLSNGQFAAQPNNRILFFEPSHTPSKLERPDFKASSQVWSVEGSLDKLEVFGDSDNWFYDSAVSNFNKS